MKITHIDIEFVENLKDDCCDYKEYERASLEKTSFPGKRI